jgi:glycosyltransferase involved in cell wall biosynthesis
MKIVQLYNNYRSGGGGESIVVESTKDVLEKHGHRVCMILRDSRTIESITDRIFAFAKGVYSWQAKREVGDFIDFENPDIVHAHNLYPLFSPSVLAACHHRGIPVVMTVHHLGLTCPNWHHFYHGRTCELCLGGREYWCVLKNCRGNIFESVAYALRSAVARKGRLFFDNVTLFLAVTEFVRRRLIEAGFEDDRIILLPNSVSLPPSLTDPSKGEYAAYVGRLSSEKGVDTMLTAVRRNGIPVRIAGDGPIRPHLVQIAPKNAVFVGHLNRRRLIEFYRNARFLVVPSICFEALPMAAAEAMSYGLPVITSRMGGLPEVVEDNITGFLVEPGNSEDLASKMKLLWENPELGQKMGQAGREKAIREYSEDVYYCRLLKIYEKAIEINKRMKYKNKHNTME